jgi:hypothetical protein
MNLPDHLQRMFDDNVATARLILAEEGELGPVAFLGCRHGNLYLPVDDFASSKMLGMFLRYLIRECSAEWILVVMDAAVRHNDDRSAKRTIIWLLETQDGGHWSACADVITKGRKTTFGDVKLEFTKRCDGDLSGLFMPNGKVN